MEVLQRTANRGSLSTGGYEIDNSLKNEPDNGERFDTGDKFTNYSSVRKFTVSAWLKRTELTVQSLIWFNSNTNTSVQLEFNAADKLSFLLQDNVGNGVESYAKTSALFRDTSAWYHVILAVDTTQGTAANRTKIYVNGVNQTLEQGNGSYDTFPAQNYDCPLQTRHYLLGYDGGNNGFRGYAAEYYFLDGITASPTDFGEYDDDSGIWKPIAYTGGFGNEGYYLNFEDASALGKDVSSNNQGNFSHYGGSAADQATDTPTNNFATLNPLWVWTYGMGISDGATKVANTVAAWGGAKGSIGVTNGKWYWEHSSFSGNDTFFGIQNSSGTATQAYQQAYTVGLFANATSNIYFYDPSARTESFSFTFATSDVWGIALDLDGNTISFYRNGSIVNSAVALDGIVGNGELFPFVSHYGSGLNSRINLGGYTGSTISSAASDANGYGTFEYAPPSGFYSICTKNLSELG